MTTIWLTVDFFFDRWDDPVSRRLWLTIQPYVDLADFTTVPLRTWLQDPQDYRYRLVTLDEGPGERVVPIPLPLAETSFEATLFESEDCSGPAAVSERLDRNGRCLILDPARFFELNHEHDDPTLTRRPDPPARTLYYKYFWAELQSQAEAEAVPDDQVIGWLSKAFEVGGRTFFDATCLADVTPWFDAKFDPLPHAHLATNRHCLLGHMLSLGDDIVGLRRIRSYSLQLGTAHRIDVNTAVSGGRVGRMFDTIEFDLSGGIASDFDWNPAFAKRVVAVPAPEPFAPVYLLGDDAYLWRLRRGLDNPEERAPSVRWDVFQQFAMRYGYLSDTDTLPEALARCTDIKVRPELTFDVDVDRYRDFHLTAGETTRRVIVLVRPKSHEAARFESLWKRADAAGLDLALYIEAEGALKQAHPAWIAPFHFPWAPDREVLACFEVPAGKTDFPKGNGLLRVRLDAEWDMTLEGYDPSRPGEIKEDDPFGPRWEYWHDAEASPLPDFDAVSLALPPDALECVKQLVVNATERDRRTFEWCQSARRLEGVFSATQTVEHTHANSPIEMFTAQQTFAEDRLNFHSLDLVQHQSGQGTVPAISNLLNADSLVASLYQSTSPAGDDRVRAHYVFHVTHSAPTTVPLSSADASVVRRAEMLSGYRHASDVIGARAFFWRLYGRAAGDRSLSIHLEHVYGPTLLATNVQDVPRWFDEPIVTGPDVAWREPGSASVPLWTVELDSESEQARAIFRLRAQFLSEDWVTEVHDAARARRARTHVEAWRSVAEMAHAMTTSGPSLHVFVECHRFDVREAMASDVPSVASGLQCDVQSLGEDIARRIVLAMREWLEHGQGEVTFEAMLEDSWLQNRHALRFRFDVKRAPGMAPEPFLYPDQSPYDVRERAMRLAPGETGKDLCGPDGMRMPPADHPKLRPQLWEWTERLNAAGSYVAPHIDGERAGRVDLGALLGSGDPSKRAQWQSPAATEASESDWIAPPEIVDAGGEMSVLYCPLSFARLAQDPFLRDRTFPLVRKFFLAWQAVAEMRLHTLQSRSADELRSLFNKLGPLAAADARRARFRALAEAAAAGVFAVPDADADGLESHVSAAARRIDRASSPLRERLQGVLREAFLERPATYATTKAFALVEVGGAAFEDELRDDFFALRLKQEIERLAPALNQRISLGSVSLGLSGPGRLGFLETLPDESYDNRFRFTEVSGEHVEFAFERPEADESGGVPAPYRIELHRNVLHVPASDPQLLDSQPEVALPSREPVREPALAHFGIGARTFRAGERYLLAAALQGLASPADPIAPSAYVASVESFGNPFPEALDTIVAVAVYTIQGDEESANGGAEPYVYDVYYVQAKSEATEVAAYVSQPVPTADAQSALHALDRLERVEDVSAPDELLSLDVVQYLTGVVARAGSVVASPTPETAAVAFGIIEGIAGPLLDVISHKADGRITLMEQYGVGGARIPGAILVVEVAASIWSTNTLALVQTRNQPRVRPGPEYFFHPRFQMASTPVGQLVPRQQVSARYDKLFDYVPTGVRDRTPIELIRHLLKEKLTFSKAFPGIDHRVSITVKQDASVQLPSLEGAIWIPGGSFAVRNVIVSPDSETGAVGYEDQTEWFPASAPGRYRFDFEWRTIHDNDVLMRIDDLPVLAVQ
ncbi:MAG: hypothetical protein ACT4NL_15000 [Pseudomarimonas sp.]